MKDFDPSEHLQKSRRKLPHWQQENCTYFITFRLHDSIPAGKFAVWNEERHRWLRSQNLDPELPLEIILEKLDPEQKKVYYTSFWESYHDMLDGCHGSCVLRDPANAKIVADALLYFHGDRYHMGDFVVMPNHVHLLVTPQADQSLSDLLHSWKRFTAREINKHINSAGKLWQPESYDHIVRNEEQLKRIQRYIRDNPKNLRAGEFIDHEGRTAL